MSTSCEAYKLKMIPYGPAGMAFIPKGFKNMIDAIDSIVETTDETRINDYYQRIQCDPSRSICVGRMI